MPESAPVATGVIGAGMMGRQHARVYASHPDTTFVGVHDVDQARAQAIAARFDGGAFGLEELLERVDAVSIAVPTQYHFDVARTAIERGVHVLVEKPFVEDPADGRTLIDLAEREGVVLQVGHVDRFNPAIAAVLDILQDMDIVAIEARRLGPPDDGGAMDSVALDLMIDDIDIVRTLLGDGVRTISAERSQGGKYVNATLTYDSGTVAQFTASRLSQCEIRQLSITTEECFIAVDVTGRDVTVHRHSVPADAATSGDVNHRTETIIERPVLEDGDPLDRELDAFVTTIREGGEPAVTGTDGLCALELAIAIDEGESLATDGRQHATGTN